MLPMMRDLGPLEKLDLKRPVGLKHNHLVHVKGDHGQVLNYWPQNDSTYQRFLDELPENQMMQFFRSIDPPDEPPEELTLWRWH